MGAALGLDAEQAHVAAMALVSRYGEWVKRIPAYLFEEASENEETGDLYPLPVALKNMLGVYGDNVGKPFSGHWEKQLRFAIFSAASNHRTSHARR